LAFQNVCRANFRTGHLVERPVESPRSGAENSHIVRFSQ
jgi:hypothetical protein